MRRHAKALVAITALFVLLGASSAFALQTHEQGEDVKTADVPGGVCCFAGLAVDSSGGDLYAADQFDPNTFAFGKLHRFNADGSYDASFDVEESLGEPQDVAVDNSGTASDGRIYVTDSANNRVVAIDGSGALVAAFGTGGRINGVEDSAGDPDALPSPFTSFSRPCGLAVDRGNANLFVADQFNNRIWIFDSSGALVGEIADPSLNGPCGMAFSSTGRLYVRNAFDGKVLRFVRTGATTYEFGSVFFPAEEGGASDVAVDTTDDHVYVNRGDRIVEYDAGGSQVSTFGQGQGGGTPLCCSGGIAVDGINGRIYASDGGSIKTFSTALITLPDVTTGSASNVTGETATVKGTVDPAGGPDSQCVFEYDTDGSYSAPATAPCQPAGSYSSFREVSADLTGLSPATTYHYRLHATSSEGASNGGDRSFTTDGPPVVGSLSVANVSDVGATLRARIDPAGSTTAYRFEYTTKKDFESQGFSGASRVPVPDANVDATAAPLAVSQVIADLTPSTEYVFRVVATNAIDTTETTARPFKTSAAPTGAERGEIPGRGFLPHDRAWEMVSPPDKGGADVSPRSDRTRAAVDGNAVNFMSLGAFADAPGLIVANDYIAERSTDPSPGHNGWRTHAVTPAISTGIPFALLASGYEPRYFGDFSDDLNRGIFMEINPLTDDPFTELVPNLYRRTDLRKPGVGTYELVTSCPICPETGPLPTFPAGGADLIFKPRIAGTTPDVTRVVFESMHHLTGDAPPTSRDSKLYEWSDGTVRYVGRIPADPSATSCNDLEGPACTSAVISHAGASTNAGTLSEDGNEWLTPHVISDGSDGHSRIFFTHPTVDGTTAVPAHAEGNLYMRVDGVETVQLNASERTGPAGFAMAKFLDASTDGTRAFFVSPQPLTDDAPPATHEGRLYMYDAAAVNDEVQKLAVEASGGQFRLRFESEPTVDLSFDAPASAIEAALEALPSVGGAGGSVSVTGGSAGGDGGTPYTIVFGGSLAGKDQPLMSAEPGTTPLSGGSAQATVTPWVKGGGHLQLLNRDSEPADEGGLAVLLGPSDSGHDVYMVVQGQLVDSEPVLGTNYGIYRWHDGEISYIGYMPNVLLINPELLNDLASSGRTAAGEGTQARVSPDGKHLLFAARSGEGLTGYDHGVCEPVFGVGCHELYLYDAEADSLQCASCNPTGAAATGPATVSIKKEQGGSQVSRRLNNPLSDDGRYAFFSTAERLVLADTNGVMDAYVFDSEEGKPHLISSGEHQSPSYFLDASFDGRDAFFSTRDRLSKWDSDIQTDVYDARVGGGFPEPPAPPPACIGDACQPAPTHVNDADPSSSSFAGPGDPRVRDRHRPRRCGKGKRRAKRRNGKARCVKRRHGRSRHAERTANGHGRASR